MNKRSCLLFAALSLALMSVTLAFCLHLLAADASGAPASAPTLASAQLTLPKEADEANTSYLIQAVDDEVCILQGERILLHTGVSASLLPKQDREALAQGIEVESQADLTALLEDITS